jgi:signal peptidase I
MAPTLPAGGTVLVDHRAYERTDPGLWDVVMFNQPIVPGHAHLASRGAKPPQWVMRIVAMPGDHVEFGAEWVSVNGSTLALPAHLAHLSYAGLGKLGIKTDLPAARLTLRDDEFFVLGDNTENANDSRFWGALKRSEITGKVVP